MLNPDTPSIAENVSLVRARIERACQISQRDPAEITLIAVSKTKPAEAIQEAFLHGVRDFGENYLQEALEKIQALRDIAPCWHYIGRIQSSKTREIATHFDWAHTVDRLKIASRLSKQRPSSLKPLNICLQINISAEPNKGGIAADQMIELARPVSEMPGLCLRGLMGMPAADSSPALQRENFSALHKLLAQLREVAPGADTLSMGMSADLEAAIDCGSTMVRVGRAIFGERHYHAAASNAG